MGVPAWGHPRTCFRGSWASQTSETRARGLCGGGETLAARQDHAATGRHRTALPQSFWTSRFTAAQPGLFILMLIT
jgi:hypothetical protein